MLNAALESVALSCSLASIVVNVVCADWTRVYCRY